ncbi:MAG TPA: AI-2E family transporter, partial [Deltaproteobacteria bacterium]|nr:AI-2E family transporter [Deltaproteobacteria bacterium]
MRVTSLGSRGPDSEATASAVRTAVEIAIRLGAIALLVGWCLLIVAPFLGIVVWALIIAIAFETPFERLCLWFGGRRVMTATLCIGVVLLFLFVPVAMLSETLISGAQRYAVELADGRLRVPPPDESVKSLPILGEWIHDGWLGASENLAETLARLAPQLKTISRWLLKAAGGVGAGLLQMIGSLLIAGVMLVRNEARNRAIERFALRMAGRVRGPELATLATATVRSVVQGILGVAALQSLLAGAGFLVAGIPGAGLWAALVLIVAVVQLPVFLAMLPPVLIAFSTIGGFGAWVLLAWCAAIGLIDNVLKPILFGRGVEVPTLVIFMGAIGGMLTMGIIGLFLGAVVLALGFELFMAW